VIGADGRNSLVRQQLGIPVLADPPHNLLGGMLVEGVPDWPQELEVLGTEGRAHFLLFPQGGDRLRLSLHEELQVARDFRSSPEHAIDAESVFL